MHLGFWRLGLTDPAEVRYGARISVWVRWFLLWACAFDFVYRNDATTLGQFLGFVYILTPMAANGCVHLLIVRGKTLRYYWLLWLSLMDVVLVSLSVSVTGGFNSPFMVLYFPAMALFACVFSSPKASFPWAALISLVYTILSILAGPGLDIEAKEEKVLLTRIIALFAVAAAVNLVSRYERLNRIEAVQRERELQQERIELSDAIHNTFAQSAYMIDLGVETALDLADSSNGPLIDNLEATRDLSKMNLWELRHPIDIGQVFEGYELNRVLRSHAATFTAISGISAEVTQDGQEPPLSTVTKGLLFSIAHNALTNAFRHSGAERVVLELQFKDGSLHLSVSDNGVGLPEDFVSRGNGFRNMTADAERLGGRLEVGKGLTGRGTSVTCEVSRNPNL